jgi:spore maturation protein A
MQDLRKNTYANGQPLPVTIHYHGMEGQSPQIPVGVTIEPAVYAEHFHVEEPTANEYPATLLRTDAGYTLQFKSDAALPARLATMRDLTDDKVLSAKVEDSARAPNEITTANLQFEPVRFVKIHAISKAAMDMAQKAVQLSLDLIGVLALWLGLMRIGEAAGLIDLMVKIIQPILGPLFPQVPKNHPAMGYIAINLAGNILGLGNATTAMGLKAMEELQKLNPSEDTATDPMVMLLAIHTAAFQLVPPATVVAIMGFSALEVFVPMLLVGLIATVIAIVATKLLGRLPMYRRTDPELLRAGTLKSTAGGTGEVPA